MTMLFAIKNNPYTQIFSIVGVSVGVSDAQNLCVGVIFDCEQHGHKIFSKFELFGFFRNKI